MSLKNAFDTLLKVHSREVTIERPGVIQPQDIRVTPSNYSRNLQGPEEVTITGKEFVISKKSLDAVEYPAPRKGDRIADEELGEDIITDVREMYDFGGKIIGFRVRTG